MAGRRAGDWNVEFVLRVAKSGYTWLRNPEETRDPEYRQILAPNTRYWEERSNGVLLPAGEQRVTRLRSGRGVARDAYSRFHKLAIDLKAAERRLDDAMTDTSLSANEVQAAFQRRDTDRRDRILEFANEFGLLWGDHEPREAGRWHSEAMEFLALYDISKMLRKRKGDRRGSREFQRRIVGLGEDPQGMGYENPHATAIIEFAFKGEGHRDIDENGTVVNQWDTFRQLESARPHTRARAMLNRLIARKLHGGLSLAIDDRGGDGTMIVPTHLVHLLYLRMWLVTMVRKTPERICERSGCTQPVGIDSHGNQKFCSEACANAERQRRYRQRRSRLATS